MAPNVGAQLQYLCGTVVGITLQPLGKGSGASDSGEETQVPQVERLLGAVLQRELIAYAGKFRGCPKLLPAFRPWGKGGVTRETVALGQGGPRSHAGPADERAQPILRVER